EKIAHLQRFIDRFKAKATKARQAQSRVKALARMERLAPVLTASDFEFEFREPESLPNPMLVLDELCCGYRAAQSETPGTDAPAAHDADASAPDPAGGDIVVVRKVSRSVLAGQRIGILGANGQGKSTLVKTIARVLPALGGRITEGKGLAIGYFAQQELDVLRPDEGPLQHMVRLARDLGPAAREQELRDFLGRFRFTGDMVAQPVGSLSGGEKARLVLAMLVWQRPNLLLLDEPTNHLDLDTRQALSIALNEFEGTLMLVSHDRALLREVCDEFWLVTQGGVQDFDGDLDDYQRWLLEVSRAVARGQPAPLPPRPGFASAPAAPPTTAASRPKGQAGGAAPAPAAPSRTARDERQAGKIARARLAEATRPLRTEIQRIDERLTRLAAEREEVQTLLASGGTRAEDYAELGRRLAHIDAEVQKLEERWLEAQAELEEMQAAGG
ncbi:MAG: ATP-binding cassette domain-containing protein, partial [Burkholderiales bacterium]|nr:ATP-binding cassette domain-containing protein [Burkholderiales bacterium]